MPSDPAAAGPGRRARARLAFEPLRARWRGWRNRLLASPRFQRWAARFPLTRPVARRHTRTLFDLCAGFVYAQVLMVCIRLELFERLAHGPRSAAALARDLALGEVAAQRLLEAAAALDLVERTGKGDYALGRAGAAVLGNPAIAAMSEHHHLLYRDLADPLALLRGTAGPTELAHFWGYAGSDAPATLEDDRVASYSDLMAASQAFVADQVLDAYRFDRHAHLLDVGGGDASFAIALARRVPSLRITVLDLPGVAARARDRVEARELGARVCTAGADFLRQPLPGGFDVATLVRVVHDLDDGDALTLLERARGALAPGGRLVVAEPMAGTPGAEPAGAAYFGFYLLAMGSGRARRPSELAELLRRAGFVDPRLRPTALPLLTRVMVASVEEPRANA